MVYEITAPHVLESIFIKVKIFPNLVNKSGKICFHRHRPAPLPQHHILKVLITISINNNHKNGFEMRIIITGT